jgi:hypothetical protein
MAAARGTDDDGCLSAAGAEQEGELLALGRAGDAGVEVALGGALGEVLAEAPEDLEAAALLPAKGADALEAEAAGHLRAGAPREPPR